MNTKTDAQIISESLGQPDVFEQIVLRHHRAIGRYISRRVGRQLGEDVMSDVFATAFSRRRTYDLTSPDAAPWLFGIATNLLHRYVRKEVAMLRRYAAEQIDPVAPEAHSGSMGFDPQLAAVMAAMRKEHRDALFLFAVADLSLEQIATAMGVPIGTVKSWLSRAREFAAANLDADGNAVPTGKGAPADGRH